MVFSISSKQRLMPGKIFKFRLKSCDHTYSNNIYTTFKHICSRSTVQVYLPHPVSQNTMSYEVLTCILIICRKNNLVLLYLR